MNVSGLFLLIMIRQNSNNDIRKKGNKTKKEEKMKIVSTISHGVRLVAEALNCKIVGPNIGNPSRPMCHQTDM